MTIRAKFQVNAITRTMGGRYNEKTKLYESFENQTIMLSPVTSGSDENKAFYQSTPSGEIKLTTVNPDVGNYFELNGEYYVDFTKAPGSSTQNQ